MLVERTPKTPLKLCLESKTPLTSMQPQKESLAPRVQHSPLLLLGRTWMEGQSWCASVQVSSAGAPPSIAAQSTPLLAQPEASSAANELS